MLHTDTFVVFRSTGIPAEFCVVVFNTREIVLLILEPKKERKTYKEERRVLRKSEGRLKKRKGAGGKGTTPFCFGM